MAGYEVTDVHRRGQRPACQGAELARRRRGIQPEPDHNDPDVKRVIEAAQAVVIPVDREILHVLSKEFSVDDQIGIKDPIGMSGVRLEAEVHIVTGVHHRAYRT